MRRHRPTRVLTHSLTHALAAASIPSRRYTVQYRHAFDVEVRTLSADVTAHLASPEVGKSMNTATWLVTSRALAAGVHATMLVPVRNSH